MGACLSGAFRGDHFPEIVFQIVIPVFAVLTAQEYAHE
jgi:hypothetical protein